MRLRPFNIKTKLLPPYLQLFADIIAIVISYMIHYLLRFETGFFTTHIKPDISVALSSAAFLLVYWVLLFWFLGLYKNWYIRSPFEELFTIVRITFIGSFLIFFFVFLDSKQSPRLLFLIYFAIFSFSVTLGRFIARKVQKKLRSLHIVEIPVLIVGSAKEVYELSEKIKKSHAWGYKTIGFLSIRKSSTCEWEGYLQDSSIPLLGSIDNLDDIISQNHPIEVLIAVDSQEHSSMMEIVTLCADKKVVVKIVPDMYEFFTGQARTLHLYGIPLIEVSTQLLKPWEEFIKRTIDILFSIFIIIIGLPLWLLIAIIVKIESRGNIFYKQERVGKNGRTFMIFKFRSMVQEAEKDGPQWAKVNDPRVTKFGKFLRSSHIDEFPQFWNVLKGEMSLVGPRPERPHFVEKYSQVVHYYKRRLVVRPGITGWWQVKYTTYEETKEEIESRLKDDFYYIENISMRLDLEIIIRTIPLLIKGHGQT